MGNPFPVTWSVREARDAYLAENGFSVEAYDERFSQVRLFGIPFKVPNTASRKRALPWHDIHHAITGFGTDPAGEGEISAWEARRGLRPLGLYVGLIVFSGVWLGLLFAPRRTWRAFAASKSAASKTTLFHGEHDYAEVLEMTVGELRAEFGIPAEGLAQARGLHADAPKVLA